MKSLRNAGQFNLKGKKIYLCSCRCCVVQDLRQKSIDKEHKQYLRQYI